MLARQRSSGRGWACVLGEQGLRASWLWSGSRTWRVPLPSPWGSPPGAVGRGVLRCCDKAPARPVSPQLPTFITKVLYTICFIWATSEHYSTPSRVIVILQEFCNQLIEMVAPRPWPPCLLIGAPPSRPVFLSSLKTGRDAGAGIYRLWAKAGPSGWPPRVLPRPGQCQPNLPHAGSGEERKWGGPLSPGTPRLGRGPCGVYVLRHQASSRLPQHRFPFLLPFHEHRLHNLQGVSCSLAPLGCLRVLESCSQPCLQAQRDLVAQDPAAVAGLRFWTPRGPLVIYHQNLVVPWP